MLIGLRAVRMNTEMFDWFARSCSECGKPVPAQWAYMRCEDCFDKPCPHDNKPDSIAEIHKLIGD